MADPTLGWDDIARGAWGVVVSLLGLLGVSVRSDVEKLKDQSVRRDDHEKAIDRIESMMREHRAESRESFTRIFDALERK